MTLKLTAKRTTGTADFDHPAWAIYYGDMAIPSFRLDLVPGPFVWEVVALAGRYGLCPEDVAMADTMQRMMRRDMNLREALAVIRGVFEARDAEWASEAAAERETERRAEAFWENRMSEEDKAREDWEYSMYGA